MKLGIGGWIGLIGGAIGLIVGFFAVVMTSPIIGGGSYLLIVAFVGAIFWYTLGPMFRQSAILKTGEPAEAKVLQAWDTGVTVNNNPQIGLLVEVHRKNQPVYQTKMKTLVSRLQTNMYQPGTTLQVKVDPKNPHNIAIASIGGGGGFSGMSSLAGASGGGNGSSMNEAEATNLVLKIDAESKEIAKIGKPATAIITKSEPIGNIRVNGNNPAMEITMTVTPEGQPAFTGIARGVIAEASVPKYQPGKTVYVKYDPNNLSRVALDHSAA